MFAIPKHHITCLFATLNADFYFELSIQLFWKVLHVVDRLCGALRRKEMGKKCWGKCSVHEGELRKIKLFCLCNGTVRINY